MFALDARECLCCLTAFVDIFSWVFYQLGSWQVPCISLHLHAESHGSKSRWFKLHLHLYAPLHTWRVRSRCHTQSHELCYCGMYLEWTEIRCHLPFKQHSICLPLWFLFRRFVWNFFRLENEHLNNCGQFRAVRDISIAPLNANDQAILEQMMDGDDGVTNRHKTYTWRIYRPRSRWVYVW